ncbi:MAG: tellurite resistance TerB family protein [Planctomycetota bacterium]|jgi:tellurite resistance protein
MINYQNVINTLKSMTWVRNWFLSFKRASESDELNCRINLIHQQKGDSEVDIFNIELQGIIQASDMNQKAIAEVFINDQTSILNERKPVYSGTKEWRFDDSEVFCFISDLGRLPNKETQIPEWTEIAQISHEWLIFPHKGKRRLQFVVYVVSEETGERLAKAECLCEYENEVPGYVERRENMQRVDTLAIALAFSVSAVDKKIYRCEIDLINDWAFKRFGLKNASAKVRVKVEKALDKTLAHFKSGKGLNVFELCKEIAKIAEEGQRYDVLELCLRVAKANGQVSSEELKLLQQLGLWLEVDREIYLQMQEKVLPVTIHEAADAESVLGLGQDVGREEAQGLLNKEFRKWNARVTNSDPEIRKQADHMLSLIAHARSQYVS